MKSLGLLEVCGFSTALLAIDEMCKAAYIKVIAVDIDKPAVTDLDRIPLLAQIKFIGNVEDVKYALEVGKKVALNHNLEEEIIASVIPNYHEDMMDLIKISKM